MLFRIRLLIFHFYLVSVNFYEIFAIPSKFSASRNSISGQFKEGKVRIPRKVEISKKDNSIFDLGEDVVVYSEGNQFSFGDLNPQKDIFLTMSKVYETLLTKVNVLHMRVAAVEDRTDEISHRMNYMDCYDYKVENPTALNDIYGFHLDYKGKRSIKVYCDMVTEGGGWTVIQQRLPRLQNDSSFHTDFIRTYKDYKIGFGSPDRDYWLGLESIYSLTNTRQYELMIELGDFEDKYAHAHYKTFSIESGEKGYRLQVSGYSGEAGDSISTDETYDNFTSNGMLFSTFDNDQDTSAEINCSAFWNVGGWWYNRCSWANLNGPYNFPEEDKDCIGINWHKWRNKQCLKSTRMMIRPMRHS